MSSDLLLDIKNVCASVEEKQVLKGLSLQIKPGEVHAIMGPNGAGKSSLSNVLAGRDAFKVTDGEIAYCGEDLLELSPEERAHKGIFMAFQYPVEIPGVNNLYFMRSAFNAKREANGEEPMEAYPFMMKVQQLCGELEMNPDFLKRALNDGFSGGEKKRNEMLQMMLLEPKLAILDETDSGLDIDALRVISNAVNSLRNTERSFLVVTHYQRLLDYIKPDFVHVLANGKIVKSGDASLALELEEKGYAWINEEV